MACTTWFWNLKSQQWLQACVSYVCPHFSKNTNATAQATDQGPTCRILQCAYTFWQSKPWVNAQTCEGVSDACHALRRCKGVSSVTIFKRKSEPNSTCNASCNVNTSNIHLFMKNTFFALQKTMHSAGLQVLKSDTARKSTDADQQSQTNKQR